MMFNSKIKIVFFIFQLMLMCAATAGVYAEDRAKQENLDRIIRSLEQSRGSHQASGDASGGKCGLWQSFEAHRYWNDFTEPQRVHILSLLSPMSMEKERVIGHFRISYDTSAGSFDTPALLDAGYQRIPGTAEQFIDSLGRFFNESWEFEINRLGYTPPPLPGDGFYPVTVRDLGRGTYGRTLWDESTLIDPGPPARYRTSIEVDNDILVNYAPSRGIPGLKVTAAHEFHHAIQLGGYGLWANDLYFYEITSTWMEDVVYNDVNDYYQYLF